MSSFMASDTRRLQLLYKIGNILILLVECRAVAGCEMCLVAAGPIVLLSLTVTRALTALTVTTITNLSGKQSRTD